MKTELLRNARILWETRKIKINRNAAPTFSITLFANSLHKRELNGNAYNTIQTRCSYKFVNFERYQTVCKACMNVDSLHHRASRKFTPPLRNTICRYNQFNWSKWMHAKNCIAQDITVASNTFAMLKFIVHWLFEHPVNDKEAYKVFGIRIHTFIIISSRWLSLHA